MKSGFHERPQSKKLRIESATHNKRLNKQKSEEYFKRGKTEQMSKAYQKAVDLYIKATLYDPNYYQAYCNLGSCYRILGKYYDAKNSYLKAVYLNKEDAITHYNLANLYRVIGNYEEAISHYEFVLRLKEENKAVSGTLHVDSLINIGICYKNLGCYEDAIRVYQQVNELSPNDEGGIFNHAMCLLCTIQSKSANNFHQLLKERAQKAKSLFKKALEINAANEMAKLALIKLTYLVDRKQQVLKRSIEELKKLLQMQNCTISDEINETIGYCLRHLKKFKESAKFYENSVENLSKRSSKSNSINLYDNDKSDLFASYEDKNINTTNSKNITQREGLELINRQQYKLVLEQIQKMSQSSLTKHTLRLILYLRLAGENESYLNKSYEVYKHYFVNQSVEIPFQMVSIEGHKAIAKLLTLHNLCENAIKHYEFIADSLKDTHTLASARLHSSLGQGFEEAGEMSKALQEYQRAYELEPDNFSLSYNIGCCLFESGNYQEAKQYFTKFKFAVERDPFTDETHKKLYLTDCLITLALCSEEQPDELAKYEEAFSILLQLRKQSSQLQLDESNVLIFYIKMADLLQSKMKKSLKYSPQYEASKQKLLKVFQEMLDLNDCPDRNQIFNNCGNIYYEEELYLSAINVYQQITNPSQVPYGNIALAYLHLMQELMAVKFIQQAFQRHQDDLVTEFNRDIVAWIYCNERDGRWNSKLPAVKKDLFYERNQYGIALIDKLTYGLNASGDLNEQKTKLLLQQLFQNDISIKLQTDRENMKFQQVKRILYNHLVTPEMPTHNLLSPNILKACFCKSQNVKEDFQKLIELLLQLPRSGNQYELMQVVIYLFIYYNQYESFKIQDFMTEYLKYEKNGFSLDLDNLIENNQEVNSIEPSYDSVKKLTILLKEWESILEKDTVKIIRTLQEVYYSCKIVKPFETEYHFPRHAHLRQCDETFAKTIYFVLKVIEYKKKIACKGHTIVEMKDDLIKQFQIRFNSQIKFETLKPISLSENFLPVTLFGYFQSRKQCQKFVNTVCKYNSQWVNLQIPECNQYTMVFNNLVEVKCHWFDPFELKNILNQVMENIINDPLYIVNQAVVSLETLREVVKGDSLQGAKMINQDSSLR